VKLARTELAVARERVLLVGVTQDESDSLEEIRRLADTAGAVVVGELVQRRRSPDPATVLGKGKVEELTALCDELKADTLIMDADLSPAQVRNLEELTGRKVVDRTELILDIFARGARTAMACDQVELAQLEYAFPRLKKMWTHLDTIEGGIGMRGPGERQIETDRRLVRKRIQDLKERIRLSAARHSQEVASRAEEQTVCLVGYTNAGKSTLMNALTGADVLADDKLFSTLDTRTRACPLGEGRKVLLSDTVGFIRRLPHNLVASFHATLEEARQAGLLLHVVDVSSPQAEQQMASVLEVLGEIGCGELAVLNVYNKTDALGDDIVLPLLRRKFGEGPAVSALNGTGLEELRGRIREFFDKQAVTAVVRMSPSEGRAQAYLAEHAEILTRDYTDEEVTLEVRIPPWRLGILKKMGAVCKVKGRKG